MESYTDRISKFNSMIQDTQDHINAVRDAATKYDTKDPVGSALTITGAAAGGVGGLAGSVAGIQHFKDFKTMYKRVAQRLGKGQTDNPQEGAGGDDAGSNGPAANSNQAGGQSRGNAGADNDGAAANPQADGTGSQNPASGNAGNGGADVDGGIADRIDDLGNTPFPTEEANSINKAIEAKATANGIDKADLNSRLATSGRSADELQGINQFPEGDLKTDSQAEYLRFKNNVANDSIARQNAGQTPASGYDARGNPTGDLPGPQPQDVVRNAADPNATAAPDGDLGGGALAPDVNAAPVVNAAGDVQGAVADAQGAAGQVSGVIARGQAALRGLVGGQQVPGPGGQAVQGLRVVNQGDASQAANAGARLQQGLADQTAGARSALAHPNTGGGQGANANPAQASGTDGGGNAVGGGGDAPTGGAQPASTGTIAADAEDGGTLVSRATNAANTASKVTGAISDVSDVGDAVDLMAGMAGPAAPIVGLIGGLISLGTTIAGLFHKKPPPKKEAPPPSQAQSIGANLSSTQSMGAGIY